MEHQIYSELYSPDLDRRFEATLNVHHTDLGKKWPLACGGAANAFLVLIGPSMGHAIPGETIALGGANRPYGDSMKIGRDVMSFDWGDQRKTRWTRLCAEMLGSEKYVSSLTALMDLDWRHSASEKVIPPEELNSGFVNYVWPLLGEVQPRIVCALTNSVWNTIIPEIQSLQVSFPVYPDKHTLPREPVVFRLPGCDFNTLFIKPHNHPSRHFLTDEMISQVGKACQWFLKQGA
jgi:hypothetical protein